MIDLTSLISSSYPLATRQKGVELYRKGKVFRLDGDIHQVRAKVLGGMIYDVAADRQGDELLVSCDCPAFFDSGPCKHVWATLLAAESKNLLGGPSGSPPRNVEQAFPDDEEGEEIPDPEQFSLFDMGPARRRPEQLPARRLNWRDVVRAATGGQDQPPEKEEETWPDGRELFFLLNVAATLNSGSIALDLFVRDRKQNGEWGKPKAVRLPRSAVETMPDARMRDLLLAMAGVRDPLQYGDDDRFRLTYFLRGRRQMEQYLRPICESGRCYLRQASEVEPEQWQTLAWDPGPPWKFRMQLARRREDKVWSLQGVLERGGETVALSEPVLLLESGVAVLRGEVSALDHSRAFRWIYTLRNLRSEILIPDAEAPQFAAEVFSGAQAPPMDWPEELAYEQRQVAPVPFLRVEPMRSYQGEKLMGTVHFVYGGMVVRESDKKPTVVDQEKRVIYLRDKPAERKADFQLSAQGLHQNYFHPHGLQWDMPPKRLAAVVRQLAAEGWQVEVEGKAMRRASGISAELTSGIDWFDLDVSVDFGEVRVKLPELLKALRAGNTLLTLPDGSFGMIPEEFTAKYGLLLGLGTEQGQAIRYKRNQAGLLDVLLADRPEVNVDAVFAQARTTLRSFSGVKAAQQPGGFTGELRGYQREGLAWMQFLDSFSFGGCLADDMGVGKTPQVLALLEERRAAGAGPSLVVVPRSLVYNWQQEAERFTPQLKVLDHTLGTRVKDVNVFKDYNMVLSTYGTLRKDAADFRGFEFDYVILDEAQAIKNAQSESAKAARLLNGRRRLAMSGTPIENHLGELWSLFEFLNPGMMGSARVFQTAASIRNPDVATRQLLSRAMRPFILRRTKEQVASELPPKLEQTLYCELDTKQRKLYNELRDFYRAKLLGKIADKGLAKSKMHVLEALLRLRQVACHPGLIDTKHLANPSAKLEVLLPQLAEVTAEGHKALVFSQFTSFLAILRRHLDREAIPYEYLDGQTADRQARVDNFQKSKNIRLFLISLKAGGVGLNLTAADYVFLLDPWWNPAVEAQAIDRTHRIGQSRKVFAYRLIARDTVEEKVLALQATKRDLADAIIGADNSLIRDLTRQDLELLLS